jgi:hypothetical protein
VCDVVVEAGEAPRLRVYHEAVGEPACVVTEAAGVAQVLEYAGLVRPARIETPELDRGAYRSRGRG